MPEPTKQKGIEGSNISRAEVAKVVAKFFTQSLAEAEVKRIALTAGLIPPAHSSGETLIDVGGTIHWLPIYVELLGYDAVTFINRPEYVFAERLNDPAGRLSGRFSIVDADIDTESFDLPDDCASMVACFEVIEHLPGDPMKMISEVNRILRKDGVFLLATPNVLYKINLLKYLFGKHPFSWSVYTSRYADRHNREFTPYEVASLLQAGGLSVEALSTWTADPRAWSYGFVASLLCLVPALTGHIPFRLRNQHTFALCRKSGPVRDRYPPELYEMYGRDAVVFPNRRTVY